MQHEDAAVCALASNCLSCGSVVERAVCLGKTAGRRPRDGSKAARHAHCNVANGAVRSGAVDAWHGGGMGRRNGTARRCGAPKERRRCNWRRGTVRWRDVIWRARVRSGALLADRCAARGARFRRFRKRRTAAPPLAAAVSRPTASFYFNLMSCACTCDNLFGTSFTLTTGTIRL